ncbi:MAG TPA: cytochrome c [Terriglobales bacterium]|jgi:mono/diheme cytochrome c family protein|nr:cytochrome c [Terriglobales bacterium]
MKNVNKRRLVVLLGGCALTIATSSHAWSADAKPGKATYDKLCVSCHGADGKGNPAMAKALGEKGLNIVAKEVQAKKDDELLKVIVDGAGKMPASGKNLSKQEQKDVLSYTRSLAK